MLGKLSKYLRLLGLDALYEKTNNGVRALRLHHPDAILLTRNTRFKKDPSCLIVRSDRPLDQLSEIRERIRPHIDPARILSRCPGCNEELRRIDRSDAEPLVPEYVYHHYEEFTCCPKCRKVFWPGSHVDSISRYLEDFFRK